MRKLDRFGARFYHDAKIIGGPTTRIMLHRPSDSDKPADNFLVPNYYARTTHNSLVKAGNILQIPDLGGHYLIANHSVTKDFVTFYMFQCDRTVEISTLVSENDPVTGIKRAETWQPTSTPWVVWQRVRREVTDLNLRVNQERYIVLTGEAVGLRDKVDGKAVDRIDQVYGINVLELQG